MPPQNARPKPPHAETPALAAVPALPRRERKGAMIALAGALPPAQIPAEALASPRHDRLLASALVFSLALHLVVAAIHFSPFDFSRLIDKEPPLEVALVNAKSPTKPTKADILAQANLDGGGNTDQKRRAKSPLPVLPQEAAKNIAAAAPKAEAPREQRQELMTQIDATAAVQAQPAPEETPERADSPTVSQLMQRTLEAIRLEAQIAKDWDAYQRRPRRQFIGAQAHEYRFARYVEDWRLKIERIGNLNYPEAARAQKLYGSLVITVSIRSDGTLENVEVNHKSAHRVLDAAALKIVEMSAPYAPFPPDIKRDTDILTITRTWTFAKGDELTSTGTSAP
ncbi:MAG TPA: TonB family protein [Casimicrobiaceae bacterium]|nr:TonB family protein [Casimicrobiaceae bacterium]